jgi:hypothetical protein
VDARGNGARADDLRVRFLKKDLMPAAADVDPYLAAQPKQASPR